MSHGFARTGLASTVVPPGGSSSPWVRPSEWVAFPTIPDGEQRVYMLVAVLNNGANHFAVTCAGAYRVDWGDGAGWQNVATGVKAEKNLAWADYAGNGLTAEGWRQALVTIEPQTGQMLTSISLGVTAGSGWRVSGLLDVQISAPSATTLVFEDYWNGSGQKHRWCERVGVQATSLLGLDRLFQGMAGLVKVEGTSWTSLAASTSNMFSSCSSLREVPLFDLSACTNTSYMFSSCSSLREVPLFDLSACTNTSWMFISCSSLREVPLFDLSACTSTSYMFSGCSSLREVPLFDLSACTNTSYMFSSCSSLREVTLDNMDNVTTTTNMFAGTGSIESVTLPGLRYSVSVASNQLQAAALDALYTSLGTAAGAQTITVSGNPGTSGDHPSIATATGWTVSGS